ncbi:MAG: CsbD family protein [Pirellulaceae bacterium]|nr:CsbD family protein [Planctomycetales bacterium]
MVSQQVLNGHWDEIKGRIQETFGQLTDDDLAYAKGNVTQLIGLIERKTGMAKQQIEEQLDKLVDEGQSMLQKGAAAVQGFADQAGVRAQEAWEQAESGLRQGYRQAESVVQSRPAESLAVAFGSGLIAGVIIGLLTRPR